MVIDQGKIHIVCGSLFGKLRLQFEVVQGYFKFFEGVSTDV